MAPHKRTTKFAAAKLGMTGVAVALLPGVALAGPALAASGQHGPQGQPGGGPRGGPQAAENAAKAQIAQLYQQAETATQSYDAAQEQIGKIQAVLSGETGQVQQLRGRLAALTVGLGRLAAQQYRSAGVDPTVSLMFAAHPDTFLAESELVSQSAAEQQRQLRTVLTDQQALATLDAAASRELADLRADESTLGADRAQIQGELAAARHRLDGLTRIQRVQVTAALAQGDNGDGLGTTVPADAPSLGSLLNAVAEAVSGGDDTEDADSARVLKAVSTAYSELGKPYVWGATGPDDFDCSGLTQHVWAAAGVALPRTSEEQADIGTDIPVSQIEPGDLVIYFAGRTHVAVYVGQGLVIHAPRPGSVVQFADLNAMPINKIVRPLG
jgi:peptidoglycan DL-endopeptidase CwlO